MKYNPRKQKKKIQLLKEKWQRITERLKTLIDDQFTSKENVQVFGAFVFTLFFGIEILIILINNSFYTNFSDDLLQYYTIIVDFIQQIKTGTLSVFNLNNYLGASYFSDV